MDDPDHIVLDFKARFARQSDLVGSKVLGVVVADAHARAARSLIDPFGNTLVQVQVEGSE